MDEVLDNRVIIGDGCPRDGDLTGADAADGSIGDPRAGIEARGRFRGKRDAVAVGDRAQPVVGMLGHCADPDWVTVPFLRGDPVVAPGTGLARGRHDWLVEEVTKRERLV